MRDLRVVPPGPNVFAALRDALAGGDAIVVGAPAEDLPTRVGQRVALVVETSGSTGRPKRVELSADAVLASAAASESALGGPAQWVLALPTHYIAGLNVLARSLAAETVPVAAAGEHFTADGFLDAVARLEIPERATALVPAQLATLLDSPPAVAALRRFQAVLVGGQAAPAALVDAARDHGIRVVRSYGSSETSGGCVYDGSPLGSTQVRIVDGEVRLAGPTLAEGYLGDPALTEERFVVDDGMRWFRTADGGALVDGVLTVTGRLDDVIVSGGVKVALAAVERALQAIPGFADAVVVPGAHPRWGEHPVAFSAGGGDPHAARDAVVAALGAPARPEIVLIDAIPTLASGKPDRRALREIAEDLYPAGRPGAAP